MFARIAILFFLLMSLVVIPLALCALSRWLLPRRIRWWVALACTLFIWGVVAYGFLVGFQQFEVRHVEFASEDLPLAFDGYRIVQFSDAHVGSYQASRQWMLRRAIDSIHAQRPDVIVFTGDLQNLHPDEVAGQMDLLSRLHAPDGVFSVLGNHDYPMYLKTDDAALKEAFSQQTRRQERQMGWKLLLNEHRYVYRQSDSICIAGMEDWGQQERMPHEGNVRQTMAGVPRSVFTVMLEHDPSSWRSQILPDCHAQLTLSGHTHGGQLMVFGWSPVALNYHEWVGMTYEGARAVHVSTGLGGLVPFRVGVPGEIVVITLKSKKVKK